MINTTARYGNYTVDLDKQTITMKVVVPRTVDHLIALAKLSDGEPVNLTMEPQQQDLDLDGQQADPDQIELDLDEHDNEHLVEFHARRMEIVSKIEDGTSNDDMTEDEREALCDSEAACRALYDRGFTLSTDDDGSFVWTHSDTGEVIRSRELVAAGK